MGIETALVRDVVVVLPGIMGSELVAADGTTPLWAVSPGRLPAALRALRADALTLPSDIGDGPDPAGALPTRLIDSLHVIPGLWSPVTGYDGLLGFLRGPRFHFVEEDPGDPSVTPNLIPFPYDWRLSNRHNARRLAARVLPALERWQRNPGMGEAKLVLVCHSMGGLVARWFAEHEGGAEHIRAIVTIGTPHRGALKALLALHDGIEPRFGPWQLSLSRLARSLPSLHQLLPQYDCLFEADGGPRHGIAQARGLRLDAAMWQDAARFHAALTGAPLGYALHKVAGIRQPTPTTARFDGERLQAQATIDGRHNGGDGTVPRLAAEPLAGHGAEVHEVSAQHGDLQGTRAVLDLLDGILTRQEIVWMAGAAGAGFGVEMADLWLAGDAPWLRVSEAGDLRLSARLQAEDGRPIGPPRPVPRDGVVRFDALDEGAYRVVVSARAGGPPPVGASFVVLRPELS